MIPLLALPTPGAVRRLLLSCAAAGLAACGGTGEGPTPTTPASPTTPTTPTAGTTLTVTVAGATGATLPVTYTCDGAATSPPLAWSGAPSAATHFAVLMSTIPAQGATKYNWVLYNIPATVTSIPAGGSAGTVGQADDGAGTNYAPPCSQGPGLKQYIFTVYALSAAPSLGASTPAQVTGAVLEAALAPVTLAKGTLSLGVNRTVAMINCASIRASFEPYRVANGVGVACDSTYAAVSGTGIQARHPMMHGITATNQQVPIPQAFSGSSAWRIPLVPAVAAAKTSALDGPIGIAINGVPIFNPCKQGGCSGPGGGDTKVLGELDLCNGHAGRADDYHYHAAPVCLMSDQGPAYWDTHPLGWALDGYAIFGYRNPDGTAAPRDAGCGGNTVPHPNAPSGYAYHVTDQSPYVLSCFHGVPSPDLAIQSTKYSPIRPPGTPMAASNMSLQATAQSLAVGGTSTQQWQNGGRSFQIRYTRTTATCWTFTFLTDGTVTNSADYCRR
jgi:phosphatidylethanolamine-binding protein (PEBP) family uncharacterized protein